MWYNKFDFRFLILLFPFTLLIQNCTSKKSIQQLNPIETINLENEETFLDTNIPENTTIKSKIFYKQANENYTATAFIKMRKDSIIWISIQAVLGVEVSRIIIQKDSFKFMNKIENSYAFGRNDELLHLIGFPVTFDIIQSIIFGKNYALNNIFTSQKDTIYSKNETTLQQTILSKENKINSSNYRVQNSENNMDIAFQNYTTLQSFTYPQKTECIIRNEFTNTIRLELQNINFDVIKSFPFHVPSHFKKI